MTTTAEPRTDWHLDRMRLGGHETDEVRVIGRLPACDSLPPTRRGETDNAVRTVVADRNMLFRAGLVRILAGTRFRVVAECPTLTLMPDGVLDNGETLLLLGAESQSESALQSLDRLKQKNASLRVVVLGDGGGSREVSEAMRAGADAYLARNEIGPDVLLKSLELTLLGVVLLPQGLILGREHGVEEAARSRTDYRLSAGKDAAPSADEELPGIPGLSGREELILTHLMRGASNKLIARELGIAEATVKVHVKSLLRKLRAKNRTQAAMWGIHHLAPERLAQNKAAPAY